MSVEENKAVVRRLVEEVWNAAEPDALAAFVAADLLEESTLHTVQLLDAFSDVNVTVEDILGEGDRVAARLTISGIHTGEFAGAAPTNRRITWGSIRIYRFADGEIAETWAMQDRLGLMTQLGLVQSAGAPIHWASKS